MASEFDLSASLLRFELKNSRPIDLMDLTSSLAAFGEAYQDHVVDAGYDNERGNVRLFVREIKSGSVIADLISQAQQASFVLNHEEVAAGFLSHLNEIIQFFLGLSKVGKSEEPSRKEAEHVMKVLEPVAKDFGSQLILQVSNGDVHVHNYHYTSQEANAVQNSARRYLGPRIPSNRIEHDQLLTLHQMRGDPSAQVGDRGRIEDISSSPVKLQFVSEDIKRALLERPYPFQAVFVVDVEVRAVADRVVLYRILSLKDVIEPSD
jgi:hypothetical protein